MSKYRMECFDVTVIGSTNLSNTGLGSNGLFPRLGGQDMGKMLLPRISRILILRFNSNWKSRLRSCSANQMPLPPDKR
jgi:hypothetical protein